MSTAKVTDALEGASPGILARARYLNVIPARDTKSAEPELAFGPTGANPILRKFATADLTDGKVFTYDNMDSAHEEAITTLQDATDELSDLRVGFAHYFLRDPLSLVEDPSVPVESEYLRKMADIVGAVLCGGPCSTSESDGDVYSSILPRRLVPVSNLHGGLHRKRLHPDNKPGEERLLPGGAVQGRLHHRPLYPQPGHPRRSSSSAGGANL
jgi:hypothetical protein